MCTSRQGRILSCPTLALSMVARTCACSPLQHQRRYHVFTNRYSIPKQVSLLRHTKSGRTRTRLSAPCRRFTRPHEPLCQALLATVSQANATLKWQRRRATITVAQGRSWCFFYTANTWNAQRPQVAPGWSWPGRDVDVYWEGSPWWSTGLILSYYVNI